MIYSVVALESLEPLMVLSWDAAENAEQISVTKGMKRKGTFQIQYDSESMRTTQWLSISMLTSSNWMGNWIDSCCLINVSLVVLLRQNRSSKPRTLVKSNQIIISKSYGYFYRYLLQFNSWSLHGSRAKSICACWLGARLVPIFLLGKPQGKHFGSSRPKVVSVPSRTWL